MSKIFLRDSKTSTASEGGILSKSSTKKTTFFALLSGWSISSWIIDLIRFLISTIWAIFFSDDASLAASLIFNPVWFAITWLARPLKNLLAFFTLSVAISLMVQISLFSSLNFSNIPLSTAGVVSLAPLNKLYSQVLTQEVAISLSFPGLLKFSRSKDIKEVFPVPHSPWRPIVIGVSLFFINLESEFAYFWIFKESSSSLAIGLSVIDAILSFQNYIGIANHII